MAIRLVRALAFFNAALFLCTGVDGRFHMMFGRVAPRSISRGNISDNMPFVESGNDLPICKPGTPCEKKDWNTNNEVEMYGNLSPKKIRMRKASEVVTSDPDDNSKYIPPGRMTTCFVPENLKTVDIRCSIGTTLIRCYSHCVYGYTHEEGIRGEHICKFQENKWSKEIEECKPFVDCNLKFKGPGKKLCFLNDLFEKPHCEISCGLFEIYDPIPKKSYVCNIDGTWTPALPFCVGPDEDILVKAPSVLKHSKATVTFPH